MGIPTEVWVVIVPTVGVCATAAVTFFTTRAERTFRLDVDAHERVLNLMALARGRAERTQPVGVAEQIGALRLLESLAKSQERVRPAIYNFADNFAYGDDDNSDLSEAVRDCAQAISIRLAKLDPRLETDL